MKQYVDAYGNWIQIAVIDDQGEPVDVSTADTKEIYLFEPGSTTPTVKTAEFTTDGIDGKIRYQTVDGDFKDSASVAILGRWKLRGVVVLSGTPTQQIVTEMRDFEVLD
jgi:hypothetical protein